MTRRDWNDSFECSHLVNNEGKCVSRAGRIQEDRGQGYRPVPGLW